MLSTILSGDRPTGKLHLGHYVGSLQNRVKLSNEGRKIKILIADTQVLNNDVSKYANVKENILHLMRAYYAIGLDNVQFILQSEVPYIFELGTYLSNLMPLSSALRNPTIRSEQKMYGSGESLNLGFINYPVMQAADIMIFKIEDVPVGLDQVPVLEYANDVIAKFNFHFKTSYFKKINPILSETPKLVGVDGKNKMSKSLGNVIYLDATDDEIKKAVMSMYTDANHIKVSDPGQVDGNVVFLYLDVFHEDKEELAELKAHYTRGGLGDVTLKKILINDIQKVIVPIREYYDSFSDETLMERLMSDSQDALYEAKNNIMEIKQLIFR